MIKHPSNSAEQQACELHIREAVEGRMGKRFEESHPSVLTGIELDGFINDGKPILIEIWAHQGEAKGGQRHKLMTDAAKMLYCEKLLGKACRKIIAVSDDSAVAHLRGRSWQAQFLESFGIEILILPIPEDVRDSVMKAQGRQFR